MNDFVKLPTSGWMDGCMQSQIIAKSLLFGAKPINLNPKQNMEIINLTINYDETPPNFIKTRGMSHFGLTIYIKKYLKAKEEELWKLKYFTMQKYT